MENDNIQVVEQPGWTITEEVFRKLASKCRSIEGEPGGEDAPPGTVYLLSELDDVSKCFSTVSAINEDGRFYLYEVRMTEPRGPGWDISREAFDMLKSIGKRVYLKSRSAGASQLVLEKMQREGMIPPLQSAYIISQIVEPKKVFTIWAVADEGRYYLIGIRMLPSNAQRS